MSKTKYFKNAYKIPDSIIPYTRINTSPKTNWKAKWIWDNSDTGENNVWMCFRKEFELSTLPEALHACISAESKYWLYINGNTAVFEGGVKRGPSADSGYYDTVDIAPYFKPGKNTICALVWYWGKTTSFSNIDSGQAGFLFEADSIFSDSTWKVCRNPAFLNDNSRRQPNYRLPEFNIFYDARKEIENWISADFDDSQWEYASEYGVGGAAPWGTLYPRSIPLLKDYGLKNYENTNSFRNYTVIRAKEKITLDIPYNAQCTPYLSVNAPAGKIIRITTENTKLGAVCDTYITREGLQKFEALGWFNGEHITYEIPQGVTVLELKYRETGYNTNFSGNFISDNEALNALWQKSLRTLYVTMRDNYMDCPDRERAQWWGDVTNEMAMTMYSLDTNACLLYQKGVFSMLKHIDPNTNVLQTVVPINNNYFELPVQQLAGICGFWTYYMYTGDADLIRAVYDACINYINLWTIGDNNLVIHRTGSWDWMDWGENADVTVIENAWYYYALSRIKNMAELLKRNYSDIVKKASIIKKGFESLWTESGYKSNEAGAPDDRANALAVISGLADKSKYDVIEGILKSTYNASPYMEYYVLEAICRMNRNQLAQKRMEKRYARMIKEDYSTLWELWKKNDGTLNHAWSGGPLIIMSKYFAGVRPTKAGYCEFIIQPQMAALNNIQCTVPTVRGYIHVHEQKSRDGLYLEFTAPVNTTAVVYLPYKKGQSVEFNGNVVYDKSFIDTADVLSAEIRNSQMVLTVNIMSEKAFTFTVR